MTSSIFQVSCDNPTVYAFEIHGEAQAEDLEAMAAVMNEAFDSYDEVNMLLIFRPYDGAEVGGAFDSEVIQAQFKSLSSVGRYAVVGAPGYADAMIETFGKLSPVDTATFESSEEGAAWNYVGAEPLVCSAAE